MAGEKQRIENAFSPICENVFRVGNKKSHPSRIEHSPQLSEPDDTHLDHWADQISRYCRMRRELHMDSEITHWPETAPIFRKMAIM